MTLNLRKKEILILQSIQTIENQVSVVSKLIYILLGARIKI